jgi:hypothetical protein
VDLRGSTAQADADSLIFLPPFAPLTGPLQMEPRVDLALPI